MQFKNAVAALAVAGSAMAQRPMNTSICDYYTGALLKNNTAMNQMTVLTLLVNTVVIGNYTKPKIEGVTFPDVMVPGILANGTVNGTMVNLLPYFDGGLASTNRGGKAVSVNFLDDGGAVPLMNNKPANGTSSNQYFLLTHLYQFFGTLLKCSQQGMTGFDSYGGAPSMGAVHQFMDLNNAQVTYFIMQVGLAAKSFGVTDDDVTAVGQSLSMAFGQRCAAPTVLAPALGNVTQAICQADDCPMASASNCTAYVAAVKPAVANASLAMGEGNSSASVTATATNGGKPAATSGAMGGSMTGSGAAAATTTSAAGAAHVVGGGLAAGIAAFAFLL